MNKTSVAYVFVVMAITLFFSTHHLMINDVMEWDEARNAVNAYEMYHRADFINLYYAGEPDTWNAKPPLFIWLVVMGYKVFGFNELALRLPSVLSSLVFFYFYFKLIKLKSNDITAFISCLILLGCNAIITRHIGTSGDFDALLICLLTGATYYFIRFIDFGERSSIYLAAIFAGLAFYTKGTASLLYVPGWLLYLLIRRKAATFFKNRHAWFSISIFLLIIASWVILVMVYGVKNEQSFYGSKNSLETMFVHDTFRRLTAHDFGQQPDYTFVFSALDAKMNMWNYLFYAISVAGLVILVRNKKFRSFFKEEKNGLLLLSWCIILPVAVILTLATNKHYWYLAPIFPYVAIITATAIVYISAKWKPAVFVFGAFTLFTLCWHFRDLNSNSTSLHRILGKESKYFKGTQQVILTHRPQQDIFLYLTWSGKQQVYVDDIYEVPAYKGQLTILETNKVSPCLMDNLEDVQYFSDYCIAKIK
jgi:4-amino-4-deoxy-L-arabinose transferase-like glycosyltransferase